MLSLVGSWSLWELQEDLVYGVKLAVPEMGMIIPMVGSAAGWPFVVWFSCFGGWAGGGGSCSCVG